MSGSQAVKRLPEFSFFILIEEIQGDPAVVPLEIHRPSLIQGLDLINYCQSRLEYDQFRDFGESSYRTLPKRRVCESRDLHPTVD